MRCPRHIAPQHDLLPVPPTHHLVRISQIPLQHIRLQQLMLRPKRKMAHQRPSVNEKWLLVLFADALECCYYHYYQVHIEFDLP